MASDKAVALSEAIYESFRAELVQSDSDGAERTAKSLTDRITELRAEVNAAEEAVERFRRENGLSSSQGELVSTRSMSQVNEQLVAARQRLIAAETRYNELQRGDMDDIAAMESGTLSTLRVQYATLKQAVDAEARVLGPRHPRLQRVQSELSTLQQEIDAERRRILLSAQNELDQARQVVEDLQSAATNVSQNVFSDNDAQVRLRELAREAAAKSAIYEAFLVRAGEIGQRQQLDMTNIRVISAPVKPRTRSWPPSTTMMAAFGSAAGLALGSMAVLGFGIVSDLRHDSASRSPSARPERRESEPPSPPRPARRNAPAPSLLAAPATAEPGRSLLDLSSGARPAARRRRAAG